MSLPSKDTVLFATLVATAIAWAGLSVAAPRSEPVTQDRGGPGRIAVAVHDGTARALCAITRADPAVLAGGARRSC